jgi:hypothetical protein
MATKGGRPSATLSCDPSRLAYPGQSRHTEAQQDGEAAMPALKMTRLCVGLIVSAVGLALCLPATANAGRVNKKQDPHYSQRAASTTKARQVNGRDSNSVYWGCCTKMGADPDPFIRSQILRDASGFFGGID